MNKIMSEWKILGDAEEVPKGMLWEVRWKDPTRDQSWERRKNLNFNSRDAMFYRYKPDIPRTFEEWWAQLPQGVSSSPGCKFVAEMQMVPMTLARVIWNAAQKAKEGVSHAKAKETQV